MKEGLSYTEPKWKGDNKYILTSDSPLKKKGVDGKDLGILEKLEQ